jgi:hypothetical protein
MPIKFLALLCGGLALLTSLPAFAQEKVVIYRCTDAGGALTIQNNVPCPKGSKQERRVMDSAPNPSLLSPTMPPLVPPASTRAPAAPPTHSATPHNRPTPPPAVEDDTAIRDEDRLPPPALFECRTPDNDWYLSESGEPQPRCVPLNTTGLSGTIENTNATSCEMKIDVCQRVPEGTLCDSWRKRQREAESAVRFGASENRAKAEEELQRLNRVVQESTCGKR